MKKISVSSLLFFLFLFSGLPDSYSSGGIYLSKDNQKIVNRSSQIVIARDQNKTVLTILNHSLGESREFAVLIPLPENAEKSRAQVLEEVPFDRLEEYSKPRLIRYFDEKVCPLSQEKEALFSKGSEKEMKRFSSKIKIEYAKGRYEVSTFPSDRTENLQDWLKEKGYKISQNSFFAIERYQNRKMRFVLIELVLKEKIRSASFFLRPIRIEFESPSFLLPIPLTQTGDRFPQDLLIYLFSRQGSAQIENLHTLSVPTKIELPFYIDEDFSGFYQAMLKEQFKESDKKTVFREYAGGISLNSGSQKGLSIEELQKLGVFWIDSSNLKDVFLTRFHLYGDADYFPDILHFHQTKNRDPFQVEYILHYPYLIKKGESCPATKEYLEKVAARNELEAKNLSELTGWPIENIRKVIQQSSPRKKRWFQYIWGDQE